jgi:hypothetical protein
MKKKSKKLRKMKRKPARKKRLKRPRKSQTISPRTNPMKQRAKGGTQTRKILVIQKIRPNSSVMEQIDRKLWL